MIPQNHYSSSRRYSRHIYQYAQLGIFRMTVTVPLLIVLLGNHNNNHHHRFVTSAFSTTTTTTTFHSSSIYNKLERTTTATTKRRRKRIIRNTTTLLPKSSKSFPVCNLFFRSTDAENNNNNPSSTTSPSSLSGLALDRLLSELGSSSITLPFEAVVEGHDNNNNVEMEDSLSSSIPSTKVLTIRHMVPSDLDQVTDMCIEEFGTGPTTKLQDFPLWWWGRRRDGSITVEQWWDRLLFEPSVRSALQAKMRSNNNNNNNNNNNGSNHQDPSILVLSRKENGYDDDEIIVGLVEVSLQPPIPDRNPPTYPLPRTVKEVYYCQLMGIAKLQGWVTNLLIAPNYRGLGYSKVLMAATEGIARSWGCDYMYLHADADVTSGKVPQKLYENLGYDIILDDNGVNNNNDRNLYDWIPKSGGTVFSSSIRMVQGVALLWFGKRL